MNNNILHEGQRHSLLKAIELALDSERLGTGDKEDLWDICVLLGVHRTQDVRLDRLLLAISKPVDS